MGKPALRIVLDRLTALLEAGVPDVSFFLDRPDDDPLQQSEMPGCVIRVPAVDLSPAPDGAHQTWHVATVQIDAHSGREVGETIDEINQDTLARIVAAIQTDRQLGGRVYEINETGVSGSDMDGADIGIAILTLEITFATPRGDWFTLAGQGALFTD